MAQAVVVEVDVFTGKLYRGNGDVHKWCRKITRRFERETKKYVLADSTRTGELAKGIHSRTRRSGRSSVTGTWMSEAPHTFYVLRGTTGPIMSNAHFANPSGAYRMTWVTTKKGKRVLVKQGQRGHFMPIPNRDSGVFAPKLGQGHYATEVRGQKAHNFLERAWRGTARDHRAIRGRGIPLFILNP